MINVEPIIFTLRSFRNDGSGYGDPYRAVCTVQKVGNVGHVSGLHGDFSLTDYHEMRLRLREYGIDKLEWLRADAVRRTVQCSG